jgi:hypothetical protein
MCSTLALVDHRNVYKSQVSVLWVLCGNLPPVEMTRADDRDEIWVQVSEAATSMPSRGCNAMQICYSEPPWLLLIHFSVSP